MITFQSLGRYGRLGNQMFQIASTIGIARKNGYQFSFPEWKNYDHKDRFGSTEDIDVQKYFVNPLPVLNDPKYQDYPISWGYHGFNIPDNVSLSGHMQSEKYFKHCEQDIRYYFKMHNRPFEKGYVAIHIRLGDYDNQYHPRLGKDYYNEAAKLFPSDTKFVVFSDDMEMAREILTDIHCFAHYYENTMDDFAMMRSCKHFIIGNSTYSWWAAWLGEHPDKKVIAPKNWFGPAWGSCYKELANDIYPENWVVI